MPEIIKASGIDISKNDKGELLLKVYFRALNEEEGQHYSWMPQWETIRELIFSSVVVEAMNTQGQGDELKTFCDCLELCLKASYRLTNMFTGQSGIES